MISLCRLGKADSRHRPEFMLVLAGNALRPGVDLGEFLAENEAVEIGLAPVRILHDLTADLVEADTLGPFVDALEIAGLLAVHLRQRHDMLQRLVLRLDETEDFRALDVEAGG